MAAADEVWLPIADGKRALHFTNVLDDVLERHRHLLPALSDAPA